MAYYEDSWIWGPLKVVAFVTILYLLAGCATIKPPAHLEPNWQEGHYISSVVPHVATHIDLWFLRVVVWEGEEGFFSLSIQPFGTADEGDAKRRCLQFYSGVKIDGTESLKLGAPPYDYVYTPEEQWAFRWHRCGYPNVLDMGGS